MKILLDTHILLWWMADDRRLPQLDARERHRVHRDPELVAGFG